MNPFTGNVFTPATGKNADGTDRIGTPELMIDSKTGQEAGKAIIVRIDPYGSETIVGNKTEIRGENGKPIQQFVCVGEDDKPVKQLSKDELAEIDAKKALNILVM